MIMVNAVGNYSVVAAVSLSNISGSSQKPDLQGFQSASAPMPQDTVAVTKQSTRVSLNTRPDFDEIMGDPKKLDAYWMSQLSPEGAERVRHSISVFNSVIQELGIDLKTVGGQRDNIALMKDQLASLTNAVNEDDAGISAIIPDDRFAESSKAMLDHLDFHYFRLRFYATRAGENIDGITKQYESAVNKIIDAIATREEARKAAPSQLA